MGKEEEAIYLIRMAADMSKRYYGKPFVCTYSGGKDSDVVLELCKRADVPFVVQHSITTVDAPQTMQHIRKVFDQCKKEGIHCEYTQPTYKGKRVNMWSLIPIKGMPPYRMMRYCCEVLKEQNAENRVITTGVRWAESRKRAGCPLEVIQELMGHVKPETTQRYIAKSQVRVVQSAARYFNAA